MSAPPEPNLRVDFDADGNKAFGIYAEPNTYNSSTHKKSRSTTAVLALLLGGLGIHYFYIGAWGWGLVSILFCWTYIPAIVSFAYGIYYMVMSDTEFDKRVNKRKLEPFDSRIW